MLEFASLIPTYGNDSKAGITYNTKQLTAYGLRLTAYGCDYPLYNLGLNTSRSQSPSKLITSTSITR
ncbi:hypothetical protein HNR62_001092 [Oceanisphaera litoralis]|nr:hypothetical protein [Oceanisphaera litoralis]